MKPRAPALPALLAIVLALGACAADKETFPSLAIRPGERVSGTMQPATPTPEPVAPPQSGEVLGEIAKLRADAADADRRFQAAAQAARAPVNAARGAAPGSEAWSVAQIALSDAQARHNETVAALGRLDQIQVAAQTDGSALDEIDAAVSEVAGKVQAENDALDALQAGLAG